MKNKESLSVMNWALKDITEHYKPIRADEVITQMADNTIHQWCESYYPTSAHLNTPETTRLNRALGLHIINHLK